MGNKARRWGLVVAAVLVLPPVLIFGTKAAHAVRPLPDPPQVWGNILKEDAHDFARLEVPGLGCVFVNNTWNKRAAGPGFSQHIFLEEVGGKTIGGWEWRAPWQIIPTVVSQPQIVCGDKPWDEPLKLRTDFPFRAGDQRLTVDFDAEVHAIGSYNMSFTLWAVSALPASRQTITHEIMIWNVDTGQPRAGEKIGTVISGGVPFDVYVEKNHKDNSGSVTFTWTYIAFIAQKPMLKGVLDTGVLIDFLIGHGLLSPASYLTSLELGNEVSEGSGTVEIRRLDLRFVAR